MSRFTPASGGSCSAVVPAEQGFIYIDVPDYSQRQISSSQALPDYRRKRKAAY
jgi:hypothetical protein